MLIACQGIQRYGTRGNPGSASERPKQSTVSGSTSVQGLSTNDHIRLGLILQKQLGKPYVGSSAYEQGIDCSKFTRDAFASFGNISLPRTAFEQFSSGAIVHQKSLRYGDLVFFKTDGDQISHVGVYVGFGEFIHASSSRGVIVSGLSEEYWSRRFVGARRILVSQ